MSAALQQQVFALDARYNAHRAPQCPNFRKNIFCFKFSLDQFEIIIRDVIYTKTKPIIKGSRSFT